MFINIYNQVIIMIKYSSIVIELRVVLMVENINDETAVKVFNSLSDKTRLNIVRELMSGEKACSDLIARFNLSKSTFSHHAKVLAKCGLIKYRREGKYLYFSLNRDVLAECIELLK